MKNNFIYSWRAYLIYFFLVLTLLILIFRILSLKFVDGEFLTSKGKSMLVTSRSIPAVRGSILDRNNFPLAISINQYDLFALRKFSEEDYKQLISFLSLTKNFSEIKKLNKKTLIFSNLNFSEIENVKDFN